MVQVYTWAEIEPIYRRVGRRHRKGQFRLGESMPGVWSVSGSYGWVRTRRSPAIFYDTRGKAIAVQSNLIVRRYIECWSRLQVSVAYEGWRFTQRRLR